MRLSNSFFITFITITIEVIGGNNAQNLLKYRWKRSLQENNNDRSSSNSDGEELGFSSNTLEKHFPENKFIRTIDTEEGEISKRNRISESIRDFDDKTNGALIVIDFEKNNGDDNANKKSQVSEKVDNINNDDGGFNIILSNTGPSENDQEKKDDIFKQMQSDSKEMEEKFGGFVKTPKRHKRVRVIFITPIKNEPANQRNNLPKAEASSQEIEQNNLPKLEPSSLEIKQLFKEPAKQGIERNKLSEVGRASLGNLPEVNKGNLILSEADAPDLTEKILSDSARKSELEIDIDKLKHVKEKLKLLNEDADKERNTLEVRMTKTRNNTNRATDDIRSFDRSALQATENVIKLKLIRDSNETAASVVHEKLNIDDHKESFENIKNIKNQRNDTDIHEVEFAHKNIESSSENLDNPANKTNIDKIEDVTDDVNDRKHEISNAHAIQPDDNYFDKNAEISKIQNETLKQHEIELQPTDKVGPLKPPGNPSPEDSSDLMKQQPFSIENPTGKSGIQLPTGGTTKKVIIYQQNVSPSNDISAELKQQNMLVLSENPTKSSKIHAPSKALFQKVKSEKLNPIQAVITKNSTLTKTKTTTTTASPKTLPLATTTTKVTTPALSAGKDQNISEPKNLKNSFVSLGIPIKAQPEESYPKPQAKIIDKRKAEAIIEFMNKDPLETWRYHFNTLKSLDLNSTILRSGLVNAGNIERLKGVMRRALEGKDITISIVGGSISAGGGLYKDRGNIDGLYYKGVADWWNKMISPLTGSDMVINNIAIGSIGTDYFSYCVKNHIANESDIVLWELSANDYNRYKMQPTKGARPLERLTRMILELPNSPALLYVNFFKGVDYKATRASCPNFEDQGEDVIAHYYKIPSLSWRAMVCSGLIRRDPGFTIDNLFSLDEYHPSLRGHAQMSLLLLLHLRHVMRAVLQWAIAHDGYIARFENLMPLPEPLFMGPKYPEPLCWTLITADLNDKISNSLGVKVVRDNGFKLEYATNFPIRFDKVICWKAEVPGAEIALQFYIPDKYDSSGTIKRKRSEISITTHTRWGGSATLWMDDRIDRAIILKEGRPNDPGKRTQVDSIANGIEPGLHTLNVKSLDVGFCLASIMVDGS